MKKIINIIITLLSFTFLISCGFEKVYKKDRGSIYIESLKIEGPKRNSYTLKSNILLISDESSDNKYRIKLKLKKNKISKIKNMKGQVTRYNTSIKVIMDLENLRSSEIISKSFEENADYDVQKKYSDTIVNENNATSDIVQKLSDNIINFITISVKN